MNVQGVDKIRLGEEVLLSVQNYNEEVRFEAHFARVDLQVREYLTSIQGEDSMDEWYPDFRSVRIFSTTESVSLRVGECWRGKIKDWRVKENLAKDGRCVICIDVTDLQQIFAYERSVKGTTLTLAIMCGERVLQSRQIPLKRETYRFSSNGGNPTVTEIVALGTKTTPFLLLQQPYHYPSMQAFLGAQRGIWGKSWSPGVSGIVAQDVRQVDEGTLRKWTHLPFV